VNENEISIIVLIASIEKCEWTGGLCARPAIITGQNARAACSVMNAGVNDGCENVPGRTSTEMNAIDVSSFQSWL
jgi:hypothetical protein